VSARSGRLTRHLILGACALLAARTASAQGTATVDAPVIPIASFDSAWAAVSRTFWDTALVNGRWRAARDSIRNAVGDSANDSAVRSAIRALIAVPAQSHFVLIPGEIAPPSDDASTPGSERARRPGTTGLDLRMIGDTLVVWRVLPGSPADTAGIRPGAVIAQIDTVVIDSARALLARTLPDDTVRARFVLNSLALGRLSGSEGDTVRVSAHLGSGAARAFTLVRAPMAGQLTRIGNLPPSVVGTAGDSVALGDGRHAPVISFTAWMPAVVGELDARLFAARSAPGVVLDLRGNPGGVIGMVAGISGHFLDSAVSLGTLRGRGLTLNFVANPRRVDRTGSRVDPVSAPLAILTDGYTASTSEFFTSGMQALGRARVFGVASAGQALPAMMLRLPSGDVLMHAIADHEDAAGRRVEGVGVQPDQVTPLARTDLLAGRDAALEAARLWLAGAGRP
jgi:carboxyl-terminal processing protease